MEQYTEGEKANLSTIGAAYIGRAGSDDARAPGIEVIDEIARATGRLQGIGGNLADKVERLTGFGLGAAQVQSDRQPSAPEPCGIVPAAQQRLARLHETIDGFIKLDEVLGRIV